MMRIIFLSLLFASMQVYADAYVSMVSEPTADYLAQNDPMFKSQWWLFNEINGYDIGVLEAWQIEKGKKNIAIVVIGTGVDYTHPDLANNMWVNPGEIPDNGLDDDGNGYVDDIHGINAIDQTGDPMDENGHETGIAGVIGAQADNGIGIAGVMQNVSLIACKFLDENGMGSASDAIKCLKYVESLAKRKDTGVTIVATNNAWGGGEYDPDLKKAIEKQRDLGILFVTTAGNSGRNLEDRPVYPASYDVSNIIVTGKMDSEGKHLSFGTWGPNKVHLAAPASSIITTGLNGSYQEISGSSSTGFVSGIIGLVKSHNPSLTWAQLKHKTVAGVEKLPNEDDQKLYISGGYAHALGSLQK
jgi:serine protease